MLRWWGDKWIHFHVCHRCRVAKLLDEHGLADGDEWLTNWKNVWEQNLKKHCNLKSGKCMIQLS
jgi:hypothetical protein